MQVLYWTNKFFEQIFKNDSLFYCTNHFFWVNDSTEWTVLLNTQFYWTSFSGKIAKSLENKR